MTNQPTISRVHLIYILCLPLAVIVGYFWAEPLDWTGVGVLGLVLGLLAVPLLMRWHYPLLLFAWNSSLVLYFLPGGPHLWLLMVGCSFLLAVLSRATDSKSRFLRVPSVTLPLLCFAAVVMATGFLTGGFGVRALGGGTNGGRWYYYLVAAVAGYFALTSRAIPKNKAKFFVALFFLPGLLSVLSNVAFALGPRFYFLFFLLPTDVVGDQARAAEVIEAGVVRMTGLYWASLMIVSFLLSRYGIRGALDLRKPWRLIALFLTLVGCLFSGFRSNLLLLLLILASMLFFENLWRTRLMPIIAMLVILISAVTVPFISSLPLAVQRTLSFLPLRIDPAIKYEAQGSTQWRLEMWKLVLPEVPKYLIKGKGYALNPAEVAMAEDAMYRGSGNSIERAIMAGDYHNGPLSVIMPFGIFGVITFGWFIAASIRALYLNQRYGDPQLYYVNTFLLAYFVAEIVFFTVAFGALNSQFWMFTGVIGLSIALNGGVKRAASEHEPSALQLAHA